MIEITLPGGRTEPARWLGQNVWLAFAIALVAQPTAVPERDWQWPRRCSPSPL